MNTMGQIVQLAKQPGAVWREQVAAGLIAKLIRFLLYFVKTMVEAAKLARRRPPVLIDPCDLAMQEIDPFVGAERRTVPYVSVDDGRGRWRGLHIVDRRRRPIDAALRASHALTAAIADGPADDGAAQAAKDGACTAIMAAGDGAPQQGPRHTAKERARSDAIWVGRQDASGRHDLGCRD
jgi:hypothetical protein